jgi:hypothetical protein
MTEEFLAMAQRFSPFLRMAAQKVSELPLATLQERARQIIAEIDDERARRVNERPNHIEDDHDWQPDTDDPLGLIAFGVTDFWAVIMAENAALAFELGVTAVYQGSHPLFVADPTNMVGIKAEILADIFYPDAARKHPLVGAEPLVSFNRARQLLGYQPGTSLVDVLQKSEPSSQN